MMELDVFFQKLDQLLDFLLSHVEECTQHGFLAQSLCPRNGFCQLLLWHVEIKLPRAILQLGSLQGQIRREKTALGLEQLSAYRSVQEKLNGKTLVHFFSLKLAEEEPWPEEEVQHYLNQLLQGAFPEEVSAQEKALHYAVCICLMQELSARVDEFLNQVTLAELQRLSQTLRPTEKTPDRHSFFRSVIGQLIRIDREENLLQGKKANWFYVYRILEEHGLFQYKEHKAFIHMLESLELDIPHMPNPKSMSHARSTFSEEHRFPNWKFLHATTAEREVRQRIGQLIEQLCQTGE